MHSNVFWFFFWRGRLTSYNKGAMYGAHISYCNQTIPISQHCSLVNPTWFCVIASCTAWAVASTGPGFRCRLSSQLSRHLRPSWTLTDWAIAVCSCLARSDTDAERESNLFSKPSKRKKWQNKDMNPFRAESLKQNLQMPVLGPTISWHQGCQQD